MNFAELVSTGFEHCCGASVLGNFPESDVGFWISKVRSKIAVLEKLQYIRREDRRYKHRHFCIVASPQKETIKLLKRAKWAKVGKRWKNGQTGHYLQMWCSH